MCTLGCTHGDMRLTGATRDHEGIVEVCIHGTWRHIGLNEWDDIDANVVCQNVYSGITCKIHVTVYTSIYPTFHFILIRSFSTFILTSAKHS